MSFRIIPRTAPRQIADGAPVIGAATTRAAKYDGRTTSRRQQVCSQGVPNPPQKEQSMLAFILLSSGILAFAVSYELVAMQYQPAALVAAFWSLPVSQRAAWLVIGLAPICLILLALVQHCMLVAKRKAAEALETRLQGIRLDQGSLYLRSTSSSTRAGSLPRGRSPTPAAAPSSTRSRALAGAPSIGKRPTGNGSRERSRASSS